MKKYTLLVLLVSLFTSLEAQQTNHRDIVIGFVDTIRSTILSEARPINIHLPDGYSPDSAKRYPVIYLLDGGVDEDFVHITGLSGFYATEWNARIPASIAVGIQNVNRRRDFTFATPDLSFLIDMGFNKDLFKQHGGSAAFIAFIEKELQPYMQSHYKVSSAKTLIGESLGGLLASEILLKHPSLFDTYIIVSPSLWWGKQTLLSEESMLQKDREPKRIYIGAAKKEEDTLMYNVAKTLEEKVRNLHRDNLVLFFDYLPGEGHASILHQAVINAFRLLYTRPK